MEVKSFVEEGDVYIGGVQRDNNIQKVNYFASWGDILDKSMEVI